MQIRSLNNKPYQLNKELEEGLIGAKKGETKEIPVSSTRKVKDPETEKLEEKTYTYTFRVTVDRISREPKKEAEVIAKGEGEKSEEIKEESTNEKK